MFANEDVKQNIIMVVLMKPNSHLIDIGRLIKKINNLKEDSRRKTHSNFDFAQTVKCSRVFSKKECYEVHIKTLFTQKEAEIDR